MGYTFTGFSFHFHPAKGVVNNYERGLGWNIGGMQYFGKHGGTLKFEGSLGGGGVVKIFWEIYHKYMCQYYGTMCSRGAANIYNVF